MTDVRANTSAPRCPECGALMVPTGRDFHCLSCGANSTGVVAASSHRAPNPCVATVYLCKVCGAQKRDVNHWYLLECLAEGGRHIVGVSDWNEEDAAHLPERTSLVPVCGEAHAQVLLSRWFETKSFEPSRQFIPEGPSK